MKQKLSLTILLLIVLCMQFAHAGSDLHQLQTPQFQPHSPRFHLIFDYAARQGFNFNSLSFDVSWNGNKLLSYTPTDYAIHAFSFQVEALSGNNTLQFAGTGISDGYGGCVTNIKLIRQTICGYEDAVVNGDFGLNNIGTGWQVVSTTFGWTSTNGIEIGYGRIYNSAWPFGTHLTQLDVIQNTVITQIITLDAVNRIISTAP